jgi:hypothetical protein
VLLRLISYLWQASRHCYRLVLRLLLQNTKDNKFQHKYVPHAYRTDSRKGRALDSFREVFCSNLGRNTDNRKGGFSWVFAVFLGKFRNEWLMGGHTGPRTATVKRYTELPFYSAHPAIPHLLYFNSHRGGPGSIRGPVMWDLWWTKWHWGRFSPSTSVSTANSHSTDYSILIIYHPGLLQYAKYWPTYQVDLVSLHPKKPKRKNNLTSKGV